MKILYPKNPITCKYCGKENLQFGHVSGHKNGKAIKWVLYEGDGATTHNRYRCQVWKKTGKLAEEWK